MARIIVITGTDTGVGKTVLTALLARHLRARGAKVAALKPVCSGGRDDARVLRAAIENTLTLDQINPWHFRAPLAPLLAARQESQRVELRAVAAHVRGIAHDHETVLVEGAGGLLSPLGEGFSTRELIAALGAEVVVVARNQLGIVNHVRLTLEALPPLPASLARVALMSPRRTDVASRTNPALLAEFMNESHIALVPWLKNVTELAKTAALPRVRRALATLLA